MTSYDDRWLGDSAYEPVFEELNRRNAVVFVHPTTGLCCRTLLPDINPIMLEIPQDTTRAVTNCFFPDVHGVQTHSFHFCPRRRKRADGARPYAPIRSPGHRSRKHLTESSTNSGVSTMISLVLLTYLPLCTYANLVPTTQILFGSDNPFIPLAETAEGVAQLGFSASDLQRIGRDNALALFLQFRKQARVIEAW